MNTLSIAKIAQAFPQSRWCKPSSKEYRDACEHLADVPDDQVDRLIEMNRAKGSRPHYTKFKLNAATASGDMVQLTSAMIAEIVKAWPNLKTYTHEERTMQAAWKKLQGLPAFSKADMPRLIQAYPDIYGPQFGSTAKDAEEDSKADIFRMRGQLHLAYEDAIGKPRVEKAIAMCRELAWLTGPPADTHPEKFSSYGIGVVHAAYELLESLLALPVEQVREGVAYARKHLWFDETPLPSNLLAWKNGDLWTLRRAIRWLNYEEKRAALETTQEAR